MFRKYTISFGGTSYTSGPFLNQDYVHESLIRRHLFPAVREDNDEIPPVFFSDSLSMELSNEVFELLASVKNNRKAPFEERGESFSPMRYTFLKFDGNVRSIQIPHPIPYMRFARDLSDNWDNSALRLDSSASRIRPKVHEDGRMITMEYGDKANKAIEEATRMVGAKFIVHTDISNCFPSLYTHAIDWALRGRREAKQNRSKENWEARIDMRVSDLQDGETNGVGIGPGSSNIAAEIILQAIDRKLLNENYEFTRYIDDYHCYAKDRAQAEAFLYTLNDELYKYRLTLNHRKTQIVEIESSELGSWLQSMRQLAIEADDTDLTMIRKLRAYQEMARQYPDASVLIYGIKSLSAVAGEIGSSKLNRIAPELARMVWVSPFLAPKVVKHILPFLEPDSEGGSVLWKSLNEVLIQAERRRQADVLMWSLYGLSKFDAGVSDLDLFELLKWNPVCLSFGLALYPSDLGGQILSDIESTGKPTSEEAEEQWLLRYQLWLMEMLSDSDLVERKEATYFPVLRDHEVDFFRQPACPAE